MAKNGKALNTAVTVIGAVLCVIFGLLLLFNIVVIVKGLINPDMPPSVFGITPLVVKSGSMSSDVPHTVYADDIADLTTDQILALKPGDGFNTQSGDYTVYNVVESISFGDSGAVITSTRPAADHIEVDDLIFVKNADTANLGVGQVITFMETRNGERTGAAITHRIIEITEKDGKKAYRTKGDANNTADGELVLPENVVGVYSSRIAKLGAFVYFLQQPWGMLIFIGVPALAVIIYDIVRRHRLAKKGDSKVEALEQELARLRALESERAAKQSGSGQTDSGEDSSPRE